MIVLGDRRYRVRGLEKNLSFDQLKVNLLVTRTVSEADLPTRSAAFYVDTLDLYSARHRGVYVKQAALEVSVEERVIRHDLGQVLLKLEALQEEQIDAALKPDKAAGHARRCRTRGRARAAARSEPARAHPRRLRAFRHRRRGDQQAGRLSRVRVAQA